MRCLRIAIRPARQRPRRIAKVAELVDAPALGAGGAARGGSSPPFRTKPAPTGGARTCLTRIRRACKPHSKRSGSSSGASTSPCRSREIEGEVEKRLARLAKTVKVAGLPARARCRSRWSRSNTARRCAPTSSPSACRRASTTPCASRTCASPAIRASSRSARDDGAATDALEFSAVFEVYPEVTARRPGGRRDRAAAGRGDAGGHRPHARRAAQAAHDVRAGRARGAQAGDRVTRRLHRHDRRRRVRRRPGEGFRDHARRRPDAAGVRGGAARALTQARRETFRR